MALNPVTVAVHAATAGWRGTDLVTAVAVALASSGGNEGKAGGLWALPGEPGGDPAGNAAKAHARWSAGGWQQWSAYSNRGYVLFMPIAAAAVTAPQVTAVTATAAVKALELPGEDLLDTARSGLSMMAKAGAWLSERRNWIRIVQVVAGVNLLTVGLVLVARPDKTLGAAVGGVVKPIVKGVVSKGRA